MRKGKEKEMKKIYPGDGNNLATRTFTPHKFFKKHPPAMKPLPIM